MPNFIFYLENEILIICLIFPQECSYLIESTITSMIIINDFITILDLNDGNEDINYWDIGYTDSDSIE